MSSWNTASKLMGNEESTSAHYASYQNELITTANLFASIPSLLDSQLPSLTARKKIQNSEKEHFQCSFQTTEE